MTGASSVSNATVFTVDGTPSTYVTLSAAVAAAQAAPGGPHIINITADSLPTPDGEIVITQPITINGNADGDVTGPETKCDILVDMAAIKLVGTSAGQAEKCYIEIQTVGDVVINDLRIHPNADGGTVAAEQVDGVRMYRPDGGTGNYTLNRVWISGSDANNAYVPLDTSADLYNSGAKRWGGGSSASRAVVQLTRAPDTATGNYNATLNSCHVGLGQSAAINIPNDDANIAINSGVYGHSARDGIRVSATGGDITLKGTATDRLRVVRSPGISGGNSHGVEVAGGSVSLIEYVDIATIQTGNNLSLTGSTNVQMARFVRAMGKIADTAPSTNHLIFMGAAASMTAEDITVHANGTVGTDINPFQGTANSDGTISFTDSIFTSANLGTVDYQNSDAVGTLSFTNSALPTDGAVGESLATPPIIGAAAAAVTLTPNPQLAVSPNYLLTLANYDWSEAQGSLDPLNGPGNRNVYRPNPTNIPYATAASGGEALTGGAGPLPAGIDASEWMLMQ